MLTEIKDQLNTGEFIWKIDFFFNKMRTAREGGVPSFVSPEFYLKKYGYKFQAKVYLIGDGIYVNQDLSV